VGFPLDVSPLVVGVDGVDHPVAGAELGEVGNTVLRVGVEGEVVRGRLGGPFPVHHGNGRCGRNLETLPHEGEGHFRHHDHRGPVLLCEVERPDGEVEGLLDGGRRQHDHLVVSGGGPPDLHNVRLGGEVLAPAAHHVYHHDGGLHGHGVLDALLHVVIPGAGGGSHGLRPRKGRRGYGIDGTQFVLSLEKDASDGGKPPGHAFGHFVRRGDGVPGKKVASGSKGAFDRSIVSLHEMDAGQNPVFKSHSYTSNLYARTESGQNTPWEEIITHIILCQISDQLSFPEDQDVILRMQFTPGQNLPVPGRVFLICH